MRSRHRRPPKFTSLQPTPKDIVRLCQKLRVNEHGCWIFTGHKDDKGYGQFWISKRAHWAHRVAYAIFRGDIPADMTVDHKPSTCCPSCCNPAHLQLLTVEENTAKGNRERHVEIQV